MSHATEIAEREALAAEAENPDDEEAAEEADEETAESEPEPEPAEPPSDVLAEQDFAKVEKAAATYGKAVGRALEAGRIPFGPCPCCNIPGLVLPFDPNAADDQMRKAAIEAYLGEGEIDYRDASDTQLCAACDGWGEVKTGARNPNGRLKICIMCSGSGWVTKQAPPQPFQQAPQEPYPGAGLTYTQPPMGIQDAWNRPAGHPHWGLDPSTVGMNGQ